jgi:hypothetical protein
MTYVTKTGIFSSLYVYFHVTEVGGQQVVHSGQTNLSHLCMFWYQYSFTHKEMMKKNHLKVEWGLQTGKYH